MILYLHGYDATSPGNHEKMRQLSFIDDDIRLVSYSTQHPKHDMQHLLNEVEKQCKLSEDPEPLLIGVGLGGYWVERIGFLSGLNSVMVNPNLFPEQNMLGKIDRPEEYADIASKCVTSFRIKNQGKSLVILSKNDEKFNNQDVASVLGDFYQLVWDEQQPHKFPNLGEHLMTIKSFKSNTV